MPKSSAIQSECPTLEGERGPSLSPFFWLREEEDVANLSEGTDMDHLTNTLVNPPVFSDIKDSDDEIPSKATEDVTYIGEVEGLQEVVLTFKIIPQDLLKQYITYAKLNVFPRLHDADMDKLTHVYAELKRESSVR
ncbi:hypothetical protein Ancab_007620 [Ancistrocladus abbreviatus]